MNQASHESTASASAQSNQAQKKSLVVVAGGSSAAGIATATDLVAAGHRVISVGSNKQRIQAAADAAGSTAVVCDLTDFNAVMDMAETLRESHGPIDGLVHLVGGWRGGKDLAAQSDDDWDFLQTAVLTTLRNTSRAFVEDIAASRNGRLAIVSSTSVTSPTPGNANYASVKAAAETWVQSIAAGFAKDHESGKTELSAGVVLVIKALVDEEMRSKSPERKFPGYTDVTDLAKTVTALFTSQATELNGARLTL